MLASYLGVSPETLGRVLKHLSQKGKHLSQKEG
jgi:hypothetical protein